MITAYDFIKSESIKKHLKKINYQFHPLEIAIFIHKFGNYSTDEEFKIFEKLMEEYPDSEYGAENAFGFDLKYKTWHKALKQYIAFEKAKSNNQNISKNNTAIENPQGSIDSVLDSIFFILPNLPVPFKDGDILCYIDKPDRPIYITKCDEKKDIETDKIFDYDIYMLDECGKIGHSSFDPYVYGELDKWTLLEYYKGDNEKKEKLIQQVLKIKSEQQEPFDIVDMSNFK